MAAMRSSHTTIRLVMFSLVLFSLVHMHQCRSLSKVENELGSVSIEKSVDPAAMGPLLLREKRMSHLSVCLYCCGCCNKKGTRKTCGYCCKL